DPYRILRLSVDSSGFLAHFVAELRDAPDHRVGLALLAYRTHLDVVAVRRRHALRWGWASGWRVFGRRLIGLRRSLRGNNRGFRSRERSRRLIASLSRYHFPRVWGAGFHHHWRRGLGWRAGFGHALGRSRGNRLAGLGWRDGRLRSILLPVTLPTVNSRGNREQQQHDQAYPESSTATIETERVTLTAHRT